VCLAGLDTEEAGIESADVVLDLLSVNIHFCDLMLWRWYVRCRTKHGCNTYQVGMDDVAVAVISCIWIVEALRAEPALWYLAANVVWILEKLP
jgi:hypothetical protein